MSSTPILRFGLLGAANIAPKAFLRPAKLFPCVEVVAVAARDPVRAQRFADEHGIPSVETDYAALLRRSDIDAVYNALPASLHAPLTVEALRAGKHVLCEKPFAGNATAAELMVHTATDVGRVLVEAFHDHYHPYMARVRSLVRDGAIGRLLSIEAIFDAAIPDTTDIRHHLALGGGALMDLGCYPVHWARFVAGEEPRVLRAEAVTSDPEIDLAMRAEVVFPSGVTAVLASSMEAKARFRAFIRVKGTDGELFANNPLVPPEGSIEVTTSAGTRRYTYDEKSTYYYQLEAFLAAVLEGKPASTGGEDAIANMRAIDAIYRAAGLSLRP